MSDKTLTEEDAMAVVYEAVKRDTLRGPRLTAKEIEDRAAELGISQEIVREILAERDRQAEAELERASARAARREALKARITNALRAVLFMGALVALAWAVLVGITWGRLAERFGFAETAEERVYAALGRQQTVIAQARGFSDPPNRDAEIAGAANRVVVAREVYDRQAAEYNSLAASILGRTVIWVFPRYPARLPTARQIWR